jgi:hypothetical protein
MFSEAASKKRRRGRPRKFSGAAHDAAATARPDVVTRRGEQDILYRERAARILRAAAHGHPGLRDELDWLVDFDGYVRRPAVVTELGRIADVRTLIRRARAISARSPATSKEAVALLRRARLEHSARLRPPPGNHD